MKNKNYLLAGLILLLSFILLAGCSSETNNNENNESSTAENNDSSTSKYGGQVIVAIPQDLDYLDLHLAEAAGTREVMFNIFEGLLKVNTEGGLNPAIAESYEISEDGLTYTFKIRKGVKFHNGKELTAKDVVYSYSKLAGLETGEPLSSSFSSVEKIESPDDYTVVITLKENTVGFLTAVTAAIIPENYEDSNTKPIGTGPFQFVEYKPGQSLIIEKNEDYYIEGVPYLDKVEFRILPDEEAAFLALQSGEIDIYPRIGTEKAQQLGNGFETISNPQNLVQLLAFNNKVKPFDDVRVRQAINYAVNIDEIIEGVAIGKGTKLGSNLSPVLSKYYNAELEDLYPYDTEKAKKLLEEAGLKDGFEFTITVPSVYPFHVSTAEVIVYQLEKIGVKANIESVEWGVWLDRVYNGRDYETTIIGLDGKLDPYEILNRYISTADNNFLNYKNPKLDEALAKAKTEVNEENRISYIKEAQKIIAEDAAAVFIMDPNINVAFKNTIKGYQTYPIYVQDLSIVYIEK